MHLTNIFNNNVHVVNFEFTSNLLARIFQRSCNLYIASPTWSSNCQDSVCQVTWTRYHEVSKHIHYGLCMCYKCLLPRIHNIRKSLIFSSSLYSNTFPSSFPLIHLTNYRFSTSDTFQVSYSCPLNKTWNPRSSFHLFLVLGFDTTRCLRRRNGTLPRPVLPRHQQLLTVGMDGPLGGPAALGRGLSTQMPPVAQRKENTVSWNYGHSTLSPFYI